MSKVNEQRDEWIKETQMFQRIAGNPESSYEELGADWDSWHKKRRVNQLKSIKIHRTIQDVAMRMGNEN